MKDEAIRPDKVMKVRMAVNVGLQLVLLWRCLGALERSNGLIDVDGGEHYEHVGLDESYGNLEAY